jgi:hypothetical protein
LLTASRCAINEGGIFYVYIFRVDHYETVSPFSP